MATNTHRELLPLRSDFDFVSGENRGSLEDANVECRRSDMMNQGAAVEGSGRDVRDQEFATAKRGLTRNSGGNSTRADGGSERFGEVTNEKGTSVTDQHKGAPRDKEPPDK